MSQLLELSTGECLHQVFGNTTVSCDIRQVDLRRGRRAQFYLSFLGSFLQTLHSHRILAEVDALVSLETVGQPVDDHLVEVVTAEVGVTVGRQHFKHTATELKDGNIKRTTTEVKHGNLHVFVSLVHTVGQSCGCRLIDDTLYVQSGNLSGLLGSLTL